MVTSRDPFPMSSPQAQQLAASVGGGVGEWHSMTTQTAIPSDLETVSGGSTDEPLGGGGGGGTASPTTTADHNPTDASSQSLMGTTKKKKNSGDIYEGVEIETSEEDREDTFLDRPLWESRGTALDRFLANTARSARKLYGRLYGDDLPVEEMIRTLTLSSTLFFMIGGYWTLRSLKDTIVMTLNGVDYIPLAKICSVFVVLGVVSIYNFFLDSSMPRHHLFYLFGSFYCLLFTCIGFLLMHPAIGLENKKNSPYRLLGWISYCAIESFGSVMVSLFWSFANSNFSLKTAKASYGVLVAAAQIGSILGPTLVHVYTESWGIARLYLVGALCMACLQGTMYLYVSVYGSTERNATATANTAGPKKKTAGILEGLQLFWDHNYVKGIFAISCLFMVEVTIIDFTMKKLAKDHFATEFPCQIDDSCYDPIDGNHGLSEKATMGVSSFMGFFGQATNGLSFLMSLLGTSAVIRYLGLRLTLLLFPSLCLAVIIMVRLRPTLYVVFTAMILIKGFSYSLNNPTKEMLYQPTSSAVRYKAKSWIDIFGARGSKAMGSVVTNAFSYSTESLVNNGSLVGMAMACFLIWNARFMGKKFDEYTASGYIVGEDEHENMASVDTNVELAMTQNENEDTSCAIEDDDEIGPEEEGQEEDEAAESAPENTAANSAAQVAAV